MKTVFWVPNLFQYIHLKMLLICKSYNNWIWYTPLYDMYLATLTFVFIFSQIGPKFCANNVNDFLKNVVFSVRSETMNELYRNVTGTYIY